MNLRKLTKTASVNVGDVFVLIHYAPMSSLYQLRCFNLTQGTEVILTNEKIGNKRVKVLKVYENSTPLVEDGLRYGSFVLPCYKTSAKVHYIKLFTGESIDFTKFYNKNHWYTVLEDKDGSALIGEAVSLSISELAFLNKLGPLALTKTNYD